MRPPVAGATQNGVLWLTPLSKSIWLVWQIRKGIKAQLAEHQSMLNRQMYGL